MNKKMLNFIKYGISQDLATDLISKGLNITTLKNTSVKNLTNKYDIDKIVAEGVKKMVMRDPIDKTTLNTLLLNNNFTCCCCLGDKGLTFIVHHLEEYEKKQDNSYENLAILCPTCHDLAHSARLLTLSISKDQLLIAKKTWEESCVKRRNNIATPKVEPIFESWNGEFSKYEDDFCYEYLFDLVLALSGHVTHGHFTITYLNRGNMFMTGEFKHDTSEISADIEISYWVMQWGMRVTEKKTFKAIINYGFSDEIHIINFNSENDIIPYDLILKKQILEN